MNALVECVPNFSEGRDASVVDAIGRALTKEHVHLLDVHIDADHHRSVFTVVGPPQRLADAVFDAVETAVNTIDLTEHEGEHPRIGAADVVPFVPLDGVSMDACIDLARRLGSRIGTELAVPVFLYGAAATRPERQWLPTLRRGGGERLRRGLPALPDFGPATVHPSAGATAVGARSFLAAYNVLLDTNDRRVAEAIAAEIRASNGGVRGLQARGFLVEGKAQVSMNILDLEHLTPGAAFDLVTEKAKALAVDVVSSELVGLVPAKALPESDRNRLRLTTRAEDHVLEQRIGASRLRNEL